MSKLDDLCPHRVQKSSFCGRCEAEASAKQQGKSPKKPGRRPKKT